MRFRLATGGNGLTQGSNNAVSNLFQLPMLRAQAEEEAQTMGMKRQLMESQIADHVAQAALRNTENNALGSAPDVLGTVIAGRAGTDVPTLQKWRESVRTGVKPTTGSATGYPEIDEQIGIRSQPAIDPAVEQNLLREFARLAPGLINPKDYKVEGQATASGLYQTQDLLDQVLQGRVAPGRAGAAVAASKGTKQVENVGNTGAGFNIHTGEGQVLDEGLRTLFGNEGNSRIRENNAQAGAANASAGLSGARRSRVEGGYGNAPVTIIDDDTGEASVTRIPTGKEPVTVGLAPKKATGRDATNAKERNRVVTAVEKELVGASDAEIQKEVDRRMARRGGDAPAGKPAPAAAPSAPNIDMGKAAKIKADVKSGAITREAGVAQLRALGFK